MARASDEKVLSGHLQRYLGQIEFEPALVVLDFYRRSSNYQSRMMDLILVFLNTWADNYVAGIYREGETMHRVGQTAHTMLAALNR